MRRAKLGTATAIALTALVVGAVFGRPGSGRAAGGPVNTALPTLWAATQEGQTLGTTNGSWSETPTSYAYAWSRCDATGANCTTISGATAATYKAVTADVGHTLRSTVTAKTAGGSGTATSVQSAAVSQAVAPTNTVGPAISGSLQPGATLTASTGTWSGSPTSYAYAWSRCDASGNSCAKIDGATSQTYKLTAASTGRTFRISVVATNKQGSTRYVSAASGAVPLPVATGCPAGTGAIPITGLAQPARLRIADVTMRPRLVTLSTHTIQLRVQVTACNGRPVQGATVFAVPIPYNQFAGTEETTGADGTVTLTETRKRGFPARSKRQNLLAVFVRARKAGDPVLGGVSTRRTVAFRVSLP